MARINLNRSQVIATPIRLATPLVYRTGLEVQRGARTLAPQGDHMSGSGRAKPGATLRASMYSTFESGPTRLVMRIGSRKQYATTIHQGSKAHTIRSSRGKVLKFRWDRGDFLVAARAGRRRGNRRTGAFHYFVHVRHPGNKRPVRFLTTPLEQFGRMRGFRVTTVRTVNRTFLP